MCICVVSGADNVNDADNYDNDYTALAFFSDDARRNTLRCLCERIVIRLYSMARIPYCKMYNVAGLVCVSLLAEIFA